MKRPLRWLAALGLGLALVLASPAPAAQELPGIEIPSWTGPQMDEDEPTSTAQGQAPPPVPGDPNQVPVNGLLALLAVAGGVYAVRRLRRPEA